jgi:uncharacterized protein YhdP
MLRQTWRRLQWALAALAAVVVVVAAVVLLGLRFWLLPDIGLYRGDIAAALTRSVGLPVTLDRVQGDWVGIWPRLAAVNVGVSDSAGRPALLLPRIEAQLSWWTLLVGEVRFHVLAVDAPALTVRRDAEGRLFVAGLEVSGPEASGGAGFAGWVLRQPDVVVRNAVIQWIDTKRTDVPLVLSAVMLRLESHGSTHRIAVEAQPPAALGRRIDVRGEVRDDGALDPVTWSGRLSAGLQDGDLAALGRYVPLPAGTQRAQGTLRTSFEFARGKVVGASADVSLRDVSVHLAPDVQDLSLSAIAGHLAFREEGRTGTYSARGLSIALPGDTGPTPPQDFELKLSQGADGHPTRVDLKGAALDLGRFARLSHGLPLSPSFRARLSDVQPTGRLDDVRLEWRSEGDAKAAYRLKARFVGLGWRESGGLPGMQGLDGTVDADQGGGKGEIRSGRSQIVLSRVFAAPVGLDRLTAKVAWQARGGVTVDIGEFSAANADLEISAHGSYRTLADGPGWVDVSGSVVRLEARSAWRYVPVVVNAKTREWLRTRLLAGRGSDGKLRLQGDLAHFPFAEDRGGIFQIRSKVSGGEVRFDESWPRIDQIEADLDFHGDRMQIDAHTARTLDSPLRKVTVVMPSLSADDERLEIDGESSGLTADHLRYVALSPVRDRLRGATDHLVATGNGTLYLNVELPLRNTREAKVTGRYRFDGGSVDGGKGGFPPLSNLAGELSFTENGLRSESVRATLLGGPATLRLSTSPAGHLVVDAQGTAGGPELAGYLDTSLLRQIAGKVDWKGAVQVREGKGEVDLRARGTLFGDQLEAHVTGGAAGRLVVDLDGRVDPRVLATQLDVPSIGWIAGHPQVRGTVKVADGRADASLQSDVQWLGEPVAVRVDGAADGGVRVALRGKTSAEALAKTLDQPALRRLAGRTPFAADIAVRGDAVDVRVESSLEGLRSDLPMPLRKSAEEALPLVVEDHGAGATRTTTVRLGQLLVAKARRAVSRGQPDRWLGVAITFGTAEPAPPERDGILVGGRVARVDFDRWRDLAAESGGASKEPAVPGAAGAPQMSGVDLTVDQLEAFGREFHAVAIRAQRRERDWAIALSGPELSGKVTWQPDGKGRLTARLDDFVVPAAGPAEAKPEAAAERASRTDLPALDVEAERFVVRSRLLGKLEVTATNDGRDWRLDRLRITQPESTLEASGVWRGVPVQSRTALKIQLVSTDAGKLLGSLGYPDMVKRAPTQVTGDIAWDGSPFDFSPPTLDGNIRVDAKAGQFLRVDPGVGKLLGLISLQSIPRRVKLDFRDIFSDGFAFDGIGADLAIARGILHTDNFEMKGPAARVTMKGDVDLRNETQNVTARVSPSLGDGVALATGVLGGPVAGVATLLVQKLLKNPLDRILSYEYSVGGSWADPKVTKLGANGASRSTGGNPMR